MLIIDPDQLCASEILNILSERGFVVTAARSNCDTTAVKSKRRLRDDKEILQDNGVRSWRD